MVGLLEEGTIDIRTAITEWPTLGIEHIDTTEDHLDISQIGIIILNRTHSKDTCSVMVTIIHRDKYFSVVYLFIF